MLLVGGKLHYLCRKVPLSLLVLIAILSLERYPPLYILSVAVMTLTYMFKPWQVLKRLVWFFSKQIWGKDRKFHPFSKIKLSGIKLLYSPFTGNTPGTFIQLIRLNKNIFSLRIKATPIKLLFTLFTQALVLFGRNTRLNTITHGPQIKVSTHKILSVTFWQYSNQLHTNSLCRYTRIGRIHNTGKGTKGIRDSELTFSCLLIKVR